MSLSISDLPALAVEQAWRPEEPVVGEASQQQQEWQLVSCQLLCEEKSLGGNLPFNPMSHLSLPATYQSIFSSLQKKKYVYSAIIFSQAGEKIWQW